MRQLFKKEHITFWHLLGLSVLTALLFSNSLFYEFVWDDNGFLVGSTSYQTAGLRELLLTPINGVEYLPLRDLTYIIDYSIWGWNPFGFHLSNLIFYILNVWAVYTLTIMLLCTNLAMPNRRQNHQHVWTALIAAALFSSLPLHSEVVSFIHCRNVLLSGLFFFLSCIYFLKFIETNLKRYIIFSVALFAFALLSKATVIILPLILLLFVYIRPASGKKDYLKILPFFFLAIFFYFVFKTQATANKVINEDLVVVFGSYDFLSKIGVALQIPFFYLGKLLLPLNLSTEYDVTFTRSLFSYSSLSALVGMGLLLSIALFVKNRLPHVLFLLLWFLICLIPVSNIFLTNPVVADRYVYLSSYAFALTLALLPQSLGAKKGYRRSLLLLIPVLFLYSWLTIDRNGVWRSELTVMEDMVRSSPKNLKGYVNLGRYYFQNNQFEQAMTYFQKAKKIAPAHSELEYHQARIAMLQNRPIEALESLETALRLDPQNAGAWNLRGQIQELQLDMPAAVKSYRKSLNAAHATKTEKAQALARLESLKEKLQSSLTSTRADVLANPGDLNKKANFAIALHNAGLWREAIIQYQELLMGMGPNWQIYSNLGLVYKEQGLIQESIRFNQKSLLLNDTYAPTHNELGYLYKKINKYDEAVNHFTRAIELDPNDVKPLLNLARLYFQLGNSPKAQETFKRVIINFPAYEPLAREYLNKIEP